ncbi:translation initiation factor IF-2 [Desulfobacter hydrogenophilus]|uniref:Translation initiation factor IF-2 n=1 Tax=Desulfobacter hydrogenophilus TaxID=2291 RepID=A0A328FGC3_9BACT|nr:translation initiation factor IF-2 [Desulfobacter hydrogenophilus]NDY71974.1 translation initiation factor IF-2 [Desulfobacter hydrogenophilus]QBH12334.1 translation initiation factor IF-2 [Desulfobacter hydrogenophilus]RAM02065.1 translation initiation factor IF-2 [Desulfobacter hydrogenophilus]
MAKVRVYELAKDLNMTNKQLLEKLKELEIDAKSHMSALASSEVTAVKQNLLGKKKRSNEVKVRPSVIRRRRTKTTSQDDELERDEDMDHSFESDESTVQDPGDHEKIHGLDDGAVAAAKAEEPVTQGGEDASKSQKEKDVKRPAKKAGSKNSEPAKIIKPVKVEEPLEPEDVAVDVEEKIEKAPAKDDNAVKQQENENAEKPMIAVESEAKNKDDTPKPADSGKGKSLSEPVSDDRKKSPEQKQNTEQPGEEDSSEEGNGQSKRKKKKKKTTPAKIVRVADPMVLENIKRMKAGENHSSSGNDHDRPARKQPVAGAGGPARKQPVARTGGPSDVPDQGLGLPPSAAPNDRKRGKSRDEPQSTDGPGARKTRRKKKSVVEGNDLYRGRGGRKKKGRKDPKGKKGSFQKTQITTPKAIKRRVKIDEAIELAELAKRMGIKANEMIVKLMGLGVMATVNQTIDYDTASLVAAEFDFEVEKASFEEDALLNVVPEEEDTGTLEACPPVVTIMGHVDHGKTSLLDVIRESKITSGEAGGITQHIGAYNVETPNGGRITFLDTPGHAAFTAMRSRGAQITDIVILVVAADDGVMPQTVEAINHAKAAGVPVVVAVNKMDKVGADPDRIMRELSEHDLLAEDWGGNVIFVKVSAKTGKGIDELLEMVLLQAEVLELRANADRKATGYVVESRLDIGRGAVATVLVKQGTLRDGDPVVCGLHSGHIRAMIDDSGSRVESAGPSTPVEIVGLAGVPDAGDEFVAVASDKDAKQIAGHRMQKQRAKELAKKSRANLQKMFENLGSAEIQELKLIVKADVQGSIEALNDSLNDLAKEEVEVKIVHSAVGTINESDVSLAAVSDAIIIGFNVRPAPQIRKFAKDENVDMRFYDIIYDVINDIKAALDGMMPSTFQENIIGRAEVRDTFVVPKIGTIAGCGITEGKVVRGKKVRLLRDGIIKCDTELSSLRRFKDDVKEVEQGYECGIGLEKYNDIKPGDAIECYEVEEVKYQG